MKTRLLLKPDNVVNFLDFRINSSGMLEVLVDEDITQFDFTYICIESSTNEIYEIKLVSDVGGGWYVTTSYWSGQLPTQLRTINKILIDRPNIQLDPEFFVGTGFNLNIDRAIIDSQGRIVAGGGFTQFNGNTRNRIIRLTPDGELDTTFNIGTGLNNVPREIIEWSDGSYVVGGAFTQYNGNNDRRIVWLEEDGTKRESFDSEGFTGGFGVIYQIEPADNGESLLVGGGFELYGTYSTPGLVKMDLEGNISPFWNSNGGIRNSSGSIEAVYSMLATGDNKFYIGGQFGGYYGATCSNLIRINSDGSPDPTFNFGGAVGATGAPANIIGIVPVPNSTDIIIHGFFETVSGLPRRGIAKIREDGSVDPNFRILINSTPVSSVSFELDGSIVVTGGFTLVQTSTGNYTRNRIARFLPIWDSTLSTLELDLDSTFGTGFNNSTVYSSVDPQGRLLCYGSFVTFNGNTRNRILRLDTRKYSLSQEVVEFDLIEDMVFPLNYTISDIKSPDKRKSNYSKTITLPGTKKNSKILSHLYEIGIDSEFNPNIKHDIFILQDGIEILKGFMSLEKINRDDWNNVSYNIKLSGEIKDLFSRLKTPDGLDLKLSDLDWSEYDHYLRDDVIVDSWIGKIQRDGTTYSNFIIGPSYSVIDTSFVSGNFTRFNFGTTHSLQVGDVVRFEMDFPDDPTVNFNRSEGHHTVISTSTFSVDVNLDFQSGATNSGTLTKYSSKGEGYVYPLMNLGKGEGNVFFKLDEYLINLYCKDIMDKIFDYVGFTYESEFMETDYFKRLVISGSNKSLVDDRRFSWGLGEQYILDDINHSDDGEFSNIPFDFLFRDDNLRYNSGSYSYMNNTDNPLKMRFTLKGNMDINASTFPLIELFFVRSLDPNGNPDPTWSLGEGNQLNDNGGLMYASLVYYQNGIFIDTNEGDGFTKNVTINNTQFVFNQAPWNFDFEVTTCEITLRPYEEVRFIFRFPNSPNIFRLNSCIFKDYITRVSSVAGDTLAKDFIMSLVYQHNLMIESSKENDRKLVIEPYDQYYRVDSLSRDLTKNIDLSKTIELEPISPPKFYDWNYSDDGDYLNKQFKDENGKTYGGYEIITETDLNNERKSIKVPIPQTVLNDKILFDICIPTIVKDVDYNKHDAFKSRISYFTGIRFTSNNFISIDRPNIGFISIKTNYFPLAMYGYAGSFDNPYNATIDLNFGIQPEYYYGRSYPFKVTENTLYNRYYSNYIFEMTSKDSRILRCYMKFNGYDISRLSFRSIYQIKNNLWRLISIKDYDPISGDPVLCEFMLAQRYDIDFSPIENPNRNFITKQINGRNRPRIVRPNVIEVGTNILTPDSSGNGVVIGNDVTVGDFADNYFSFGNNNILGASASNVFAVGNGISSQSGEIILGGPNDTVDIGNVEVENEKKWIDYTEFNSNLGTGFVGPNPTSGNIGAIEIQPDGKILACGFFYFLNGNARNGIVRLNPDGTEDTSFYSNLGTAFGTSGIPKTIFIQDDGKILIGGEFDEFNGNVRNGLIRLNTDGTEDTSFYSNLGSGFSSSTSLVNNVKVDSFGRILVVGGFDELDGVSAYRAVRLNSDGTRDNTFNLVFDDIVYDCEVLENGDIIFVGDFSNFGTYDFFRRTNSNGFTIPTTYMIDNAVWTITKQTDGKIILSGVFSNFNGNVRNGIVRLNPSGTEDTLFYSNLGTACNPGDITDVKIIDGNIFITGFFSTFNGQSRDGLVVLDSDGVETSFYQNLLDETTSSVFNPANSLVCNGDSDFVIFGGSFTSFLGIYPNIRLASVKLDISSSIKSTNVSVDKLLKLTPQPSDPINAVEGDVYYRSGVGIRFYDGTIWRTLDFT